MHDYLHEKNINYKHTYFKKWQNQNETQFSLEKPALK